MRKIISLSILTVAFILGACQGRKKASDQPVISVSIAPQKYFIEQLMGSDVEVNVMIPKGSNHGTYSPSPMQIKGLARSSAYIMMGYLSFEATWKRKLEVANPEMKWFDLSNGIDMIQGEHHHHHHGDDHVCTGGIDPHTWTSPVEVKLIMKNLSSYLSELFPDRSSIIKANCNKFLTQLERLEERLSRLQGVKPGMNFMIFHPAYSYLARAYGFNQITIEFEGKTPTPGRLKETIEHARSKDIKVIYIQQEFDRSNAKVIAEEIGATTVQVHPLSENWMKEMELFISHLEQQ